MLRIGLVDALGGALVFNIILNLLLIPELGIVGACVATLAAELMLAISYTVRYLTKSRQKQRAGTGAQ